MGDGRDGSAGHRERRAPGAAPTPAAGEGGRRSTLVPTARYGSARLGVAWRGTARHGLGHRAAWVGTARLSTVWLGSVLLRILCCLGRCVQRCLVWHGSAQLSSARDMMLPGVDSVQNSLGHFASSVNMAHLRSAQLSSAQPCSEHLAT